MDALRKRPKKGDKGKDDKGNKGNGKSNKAEKEHPNGQTPGGAPGSSKPPKKNGKGKNNGQRTDKANGKGKDKGGKQNPSKGKGVGGKAPNSQPQAVQPPRPAQWRGGTNQWQKSWQNGWNSKTWWTGGGYGGRRGRYNAVH